MNSRPTACLECGSEFAPARSRGWRHHHQGRGLCGPCHVIARREGTLDQWPQTTTRGHAREVIEDVVWLVTTGESVDRWRDRLGYTGKADSLARLLRKQGRHDLARKLAPLVHRERTAA